MQSELEGNHHLSKANLLHKDDTELNIKRHMLLKSFCKAKKMHLLIKTRLLKYTKQIEILSSIYLINQLRYLYLPKYGNSMFQ